MIPKEKEISTGIKVPDLDQVKQIKRLEECILDNFEGCEIEWIHRFAPGMYSREMIVEEDTLITGAIHKTEHISVFLEGAMIVPDGDGDSIMIEAPMVEICQPGAKRVGIALERCRWITFHPTNEQDIRKCEEMFFTNEIEDVVPLLGEPTGYEVKEKDFALAQRSPVLEHKED